MKKEPIDVWRMSASRPWQLKDTSQSLFDKLKYSGELRYHLIESVLVEELSQQCVEYAKSIGYQIHIIRPAKGQGFAMDYALRNIIKSKYSLKWEDDFVPEVDIPLDTCVELMEKYSHINQICFNKRETIRAKRCSTDCKQVKSLGYKLDIGEEDKDGIVNFWWPKKQRYFKLNNKDIPLVVKEKWWFGSSIWRMGYIRPKFRFWPSNTHNLMNDKVLLPLAGYLPGEGKDFEGKSIPSVEQIEKHIGCYIYGKTGDKRMVFHNGKDDSLWNGELLERWKEEGREIIGS